MDDPPQDEGRSEHPVHKTSHSEYPPHVPATQGGSIAGSDTHRYRPAPLNLRTSTSRSMGVSGNYSNYYQESSSGHVPAISSNLLAYGTDYENETRNQGQGMGSYSHGMMMYNVPHAAAQPSVYDTQQFTPRQHAAMQMMPSDVASTYFASEAAGNTGTPLRASGHHGSSNTPSVYHQNQHQAPCMPYSSSMPSINELHHEQQSSSSHPHPGATETRDLMSNEEAAAEKWVSFRRQLGMVFQDISLGQLEEALETLLEISAWLLSQVVELGLHQDNHALHEDRLRLWNDFNHAWLALAYQQKELMSSGKQISRSQRLMTEEAVQKMGDELIRLCDGFERHGLVDYQYGVWEDQIEAGKSQLTKHQAYERLSRD
ncbi:hypothetical protein E4U42_002420 [Claviceps africana]|uniref:Uncharacterized protein n=1 Tax=Claviceps africana TaxID=83212 RepID=A0A8K0JE62_9HYPO|nr:hypothetical protein E4U42_002420 [Claviceps africana]